MAKRKEIKSPIRYMTDEEFEAMHLKNDKPAFMQKLMDVTSNDSSFSVRNVRRDNKPKKTFPQKQSIDDNSFVFEDTSSLIGDNEWENMMTKFDELSPIEDITDEELYYYRRQPEGDKFDNMFKKEHSMLNEVLADLQKRSKLINGKINSMSGKGTYGVSKNFVELVESSSTLDNTKLQVIKSLVDIKKTIVDLRIKEMKANPDAQDEEDLDTVADQFYRSIVSGRKSDYINGTMNQLGTSANAVPKYDGNDVQLGYNLSQPMSINSDTDDEDDDVDEYGYIKNENKDVTICVQRFSDGTMSFIAVDGDGNFLDKDEYELPDNSIIDSYSSRPDSSFIYDIYQRRYKIIDIDTDYESLDDLDDDE